MIISQTIKRLFRRGALLLTFSFFLFAVSTLVAPRVYAESADQAGFTGEAGRTECRWLNASWIGCSGYLFAYDINASAASGVATFKLTPNGLESSDGGNKGYNSLEGNNDTYYLILSGTDSGFIATSANASSGVAVKQITEDGATRNLLLATGGSSNGDRPTNDYGPTDTETVQDGADYDDWVHGYDNKQVFEVCGLYAKAAKPCYDSSGTSLFAYLASAPDATAAGSAIVDAKASEEDCGRDSGSLGFVLCPILETTQTAVQKLIGADGSTKGFLVELLTITPLEANDSSELYKGWKAIRDIALGLYVLIFVLIVFGNGIGYDPYTIKRALPRLAAGALLTWASFFIMQTLVDLSNLVGNAVPALLASITDNADISTFNISLDFGVAGLTIVLAIILAFVALGALIVGMAGLIYRIILIYGLVLIAPIAFAAWVLPNTEGLFKKWWKNLIKVLAMFPIVTGMLALALFFQATVDTTGSAVLQIAASLAPLIAIILIPKTFKWGGEAFAAGAGYLAGKATQGKDFAKNQGQDRVGSSMKDGAGAKALRAIGTKKTYTGELDENGKRKFKREPRMGVSRIPGIGGVTATKAEVATARREARIKSRAEEGIKDINQDGLERIYKSMSAHQRSTPRGLAVKGELDKKRGEMLKDYAEAVKTGNDTSFFKSRIESIDGVMGGTYSANTEARMNNIEVEDRRSKGASLPGDTRVDVPKAEPGAAPGSPIKRAWQDRSGNRGQGGFIDPSGFGGSSSGGTTAGGSATSGGGTLIPPPPPPTGTTRNTTNGTPIPTPPPPSGGAPVWNNPTITTPPPPSGNVPVWTNPGAAPAQPPPPSGSSSSAAPPPYTGPAAPWQPAPGSRTAPPPPPSGGASTGSGSSTVINNVTNENSTTNNNSTTNSFKTVLNNNGVPSSIALGAATQLGSAKKRFGEGSAEHDSLAGIESKLNDLGRMIQSGSLSQTRLRDNIRDIHQDIDRLPPGAHDQQDNLRGVLDNIENNATDGEE